MDILKDKVVLVTGSSRGIGRAIAKKCALAGADVVVNYRKSGGSSQAQGEELCREIEQMGGRALMVHANIADRDSVKAMLTEVNEKMGRLDYLILNAAKAPFKPIEKLFERELRQLVDTNYIGNIFCIQAALPMLEKTEGKIIFISSLGSRFYNPLYPLGSMKAAMESVVRDCGESLRSKNISVNAVCGGIVKTDSFKVLRQFWDNIDMLPPPCMLSPKK